MTTDKTTTTRRALLAGLATVPIAGIAGQATATTSNRAAWDRAIIEWQQANRAADEAGAAYDRAWKAVQTQAPEPALTAHHFTGTEHPRVLLYTADIDERLARYERIVPVSVFPAAEAERSVQEARTIAEQIKAFREARQAAGQRHDEDRLAELHEKAMSDLAAAETALIEMPAPDTTALLWKLERLWGEDVENGESGGSYCHEWIAAVMADARRLLDRRV